MSTMAETSCGGIIAGGAIVGGGGGGEGLIAIGVPDGSATEVTRVRQSGRNTREASLTAAITASDGLSTS